MTNAQKTALALVADRKLLAHCDKWVWHFRDDMGDTVNRRTVKSLEAAGLIRISYYRDGAGVSLTEAGRKAVKTH